MALSSRHYLGALAIEQASIVYCIQSSTLQSHWFSSSSFLLRLCQIQALFSVVSLLIQKSPCYRNVVRLDCMHENLMK